MFLQEPLQMWMKVQELLKIAYYYSALNFRDLKDFLKSNFHDTTDH